MAPPSWALPALAIGAAILIGLHLLEPDGVWGDGTYYVALAAASLVAGVAARACRGRARGGWTLVALGVALSAAADLVYLAIELQSGVGPELSIADALWLAAYAALGLGILRLTPGRERVGGQDVDAIIDSLVPAILALLVLWELVLADLVADATSSALSRAVWTAYPVLDVMLLALVLRLAIHHHRSRSRSLVLVGVGIACWLAADLGYLHPSADDVARWLDVGWMAASLVLAAAVVARAGEGAPADSVGHPVHRGRMWVVMVPLLVPAGVEIHGFVNGTDANPYALAAATVALVALASVRGHRLIQTAERARRAVQASEAHYRALAENSADAALVVDPAGHIIETSGVLERIVGRTGDEVLGRTLGPALGCVDGDALTTFIDRVRRTPREVAEHELEVEDADGGRRWLAVRLVNLLDDPAVSGLVVNLQDVTERREAQAALAHQAFHDDLTGLANHALFTDRIEQAIRRTARSGVEVAVLYIDVDGFKSINDRFGHSAGNAVLVEVASRLRATVRSADTVARLSGDEFAVLVEPTHQGTGEAETTADRILQVLSSPIDLAGQQVTISASIGVACADVTGSPAALLRNADIAMYRAKGGGKARVVMYDEQMGAEVGDAVRLEADLAGVLERDELELHYQPVLELTTGRLSGFEALVRWRHPELGLLGPDRFIPLSESSGLIGPIGRWVLETACEAASRWQDAGECPPPLTMAVNLSAVQLATDEVVDHVRRALDRNGLDPRLLVLEITETALVGDPAAAAVRLGALRQLGVRLAIDDFGTGYSSLSYLRQFPVDIIKIDRSFVDTITAEAELPPIVRGLIDLARTLELEIIAEGIETDTQHQGLRRQACDLGQGFHFARPMPAADVDRLLAHSPRLPVGESRAAQIS